MKIIIPLLGTFSKEGGWRVLSQLSNHWQAEGHEVVFLSYIVNKEPYFPTTAKILFYDNDGEVHSNGVTSYKKPFGRFFGMRKALRKALDSMEADVVLATHSFTALPVKKSKIKAKKFYYVQAYEPGFFHDKSLLNYVLKYISTQSYKLGLNIIVNSPMFFNFEEIRSAKLAFPGLDLENFKPAENKKYGAKDKIIIGTIGRKEKHKGTSYILEAFKLLRAELGEKVELHVAFGDESMQGEGVKIINFKGDNYLAEYYKSLDLYICAGLIELKAVHYPVIEAMACKVPVITTGYLPANESNSWMIPSHDEIAIKDKVLEFLKESENVIENKVSVAFEDIQQFSWKIVSKKMLRYFEENK